jgi:uncharacterized protein (TIGR03083 family)
VIDATPALAPERAALLELLRGMSPADWERPTECPAWTVKGIVLHILGDDLSLLSRQRDVSTDSLTLYAAHHPGMELRALLDGFNEQWVTAAEFLSVPLVVELLALVGEWSDAFYETVGPDTVAREPVGFFAATGPSPYWQLIAREYAERVIHQSQIRRAIGAPELDGEIVEWMARVVVHAIAHWLVDYRAADGATIAVDLGAAGSWTWRRDPSAWAVIEGVDSPAARVTVAADRVVALLTRGASPAEATKLLTVGGDEQLALGAMAVAAPLLGSP